MRNYLDFKQPVKVLFTDIDDTLTNDGKLGSGAYNMLWKLADHGVEIIPVTGRPAGWCELICRMWPVRGVIGENGAFYFSYYNKKMKRHFVIDENQRRENSKKLLDIQNEILKKVPGAALASDQFTRLFDLAIDFCEDVEPLAQSEIQNIVDIFHNFGATAKVSSIHVNGWFGTYDKKTMCQAFYEKEYRRPLVADLDQCLFVGDSPNDEPLFDFFKNSFAVSNIEKFSKDITTPPEYLIPAEGGDGFELLGQHLLGLL